MSLGQQHGFGEHIWTIDINTVQQLLYLCKYLRIPPVSSLTHSISLRLRNLLRDQHHTYQDINSVLLTTCVPETIFPCPMLDSDGILCS